MKQNYSNMDDKVIKKIVVDQATVLLLYVDETKIPPEEGIKNLLALDQEEKLLWWADLPQDRPYSYYNDIRHIEGKLFAWCGSMMYEINLKNGEILSATLVK